MDLIFTDLNSDNKKIDKSKLTDKPICIIIGPEGDFSEAERGGFFLKVFSLLKLMRAF